MFYEMTMDGATHGVCQRKLSDYRMTRYDIVRLEVLATLRLTRVCRVACRSHSSFLRLFYVPGSLDTRLPMSCPYVQRIGVTTWRQEEAVASS